MGAAAKLSVLNPNEFELWKTRIEQYFLMTDYALLKVILNGDSPPPTRSVDGVKKAYPPTTVEEKLARKNYEDENEIETDTKQIKPSFAKVKLVKPTEHVKSPRKSIKQEESNRQTKYPSKNIQSPRVLTNSSLKTLNTARQTSSRATQSVNTARPINTAYPRSVVNGARPTSNVFNKAHSHGNPQQELQEKGVIDSGCSRHMTRNISYLSKYEEIDGGYVAFEGDPKRGKITGKFDTNADEGFFVGYSTHNKAFRVFNTRTKIVEENLHITFLENKPNVIGIGPNWMFDIDTLTMSMNYQPVFVGNQTNGNAGPKSLEDEVADNAGKKSTKVLRNENEDQDPAKEGEAANTNSTNILNTISSPVNAVSSSFTTVDPRRERTQRNEFENLPTDPFMPDLEDTADTGIFSGAYDDEVKGAVADFNNLELTTVFSPIPTTRIHKDHPKKQIIGHLLSALQTRRMTNTSQEHAMVTYIKKQRRTNHKDYQNCLLSCFLS
nr:hypothetical protein [Tanacetum cinerariifolium]